MEIGESIIFACCLMTFVFAVLVFLWGFLSLSSWFFQKINAKLAQEKTR